MPTHNTTWLKRKINNVMTKTFAISHVKSTYYDYSEGTTLDDVLIETEDFDQSASTEAEISPVILSKINEVATAESRNFTLLNENKAGKEEVYTNQEIDEMISSLETNKANGKDVEEHVAASVTDVNGVHGFKVSSDKKAYAKINGTWVEIAGSGGGSSSNTTFNITTTATSLAGKTVELYTVDGVKVTQSSFSDSLSCIISISIPVGNYYLLCDGFKYEVSIIAQGNTITVNFDEATYPVTFTVEGANEDNITITGNDITPINVIFATSQTSKSVTMTLTPVTNGKSFTFTSSVAKDTTNGTSNYTKSIVLNKSTTSVKCMPNGALYWYGNECIGKTGGWDTKTYHMNGSGGSFTKQTDSIKCTGSTNDSGGCCGVSTNNKVNLSGYTTFKVYLKSSTSSNYNKSEIGVSPINGNLGNNITASGGKQFRHQSIGIGSLDITGLSEMYCILLSWVSSTVDIFTYAILE